jgi:hypothetical protein
MYMVEVRNAHKISVGKPGGRGPLTRPRHRCEDNIKTELKSR